jgi:hypothetical protein
MPNFLLQNVNKREPDFLSTKLKESRTRNSVDILFLGSSHAYRSFDGRIFEKYGYSSMNLGSSAQTHKQTHLIIEEFAEGLNPDLVVYEVYPKMFSINGAESNIQLSEQFYLFHKERGQLFENMVESKRIRIWNNFIYNSYEYFILDEENQALKRGNDHYVQGGFIEKKLAFYKEKPFETKKLKPLQTQLNYFQSNLSFFKNRNIPVVLVQASYTKDYYNSIENIDYYNDYFNSLDIPYYNFNEILNLKDSRDFYESHHLNQNGVEKFDRALIERFRTDGILKP